MPAFQNRSYDETADGIAGLLRVLAFERGGTPDVVVTFEPIPASTVDIEYIWPRLITVRLPIAPPHSDSDRHRFLSAWILFVTVKLRYPDVSGRCRLWLDDLPAGPGLVFCGNTTGHVLVPDPVFLESRGYLYLRQQVAAELRPWNERRPDIFWRGASTGSRHHLRVSDWQAMPRLRLCLLTRDWARDDLFDVGLSSIVQFWDPREVEAISEAGLVRAEVPLLEFGAHRHSIDIDGNSNSWLGLFSKLLMGNTVLKVDSGTGHRQWFYDALIPWRNFVPVTADMADLLDVAEWLHQNPLQAEAIAAGGRALAATLTFDAVLDAAAPRILAALRT